MKKYLRIMIVVVSIFLLTGCMKVEFSMGINKDGSMNFQIIEAFDKSMMDGSDFTSEQSNFKDLEKQGFYIQEYAEDEMKGYKITKYFDDINVYSIENESFVGDLNEFLEEGEGSLFTVTKGFFKNKYSAKLSVSSGDLDSNIDSSQGSMDDSSINTDFDFSDDLDDDTSLDGFDSSNEIPDYSQMMANMELNFVVNLPYEAISNNASNVNNDGKNLTWNLMTHQSETLDFEFELYNMTNIYIVVGGVLLGLILLIVLIVKSSGKNTSNNSVSSYAKSNNYDANNNFNSSVSNNVQNTNNSMLENDKSFLIGSNSVNVDNNINEISNVSNQSFFQPTDNINVVSNDVADIKNVQYIEDSSSNSINNFGLNQDLNNSFIQNEFIPNSVNQVQNTISTVEPVNTIDLGNNINISSDLITPASDTNIIGTEPVLNNSFTPTEVIANPVDLVQNVASSVEPVNTINLGNDINISNNLTDSVSDTNIISTEPVLNNSFTQTEVIANPVDLVQNVASSVEPVNTINLGNNINISSDLITPASDTNNQ